MAREKKDTLENNYSTQNIAIMEKWRHTILIRHFIPVTLVEILSEFFDIFPALLTIDLYTANVIFTLIFTMLNF